MWPLPARPYACQLSTAVHVLDNKAVFGTVSNSRAEKCTRFSPWQREKKTPKQICVESLQILFTFILDFAIQSLHKFLKYRWRLLSAHKIQYKFSLTTNKPPWLFCLPSSLSCPVLTNEQTLSVLKNGQGPEAMFRIQMFKFVGSSYSNIFLHCNVQICHNTPGLCQPVSEFMQHPFLKLVVRGQFRQAACVQLMSLI